MINDGSCLAYADIFRSYYIKRVQALCLIIIEIGYPFLGKRTIIALIAQHTMHNKRVVTDIIL